MWVSKTLTPAQDAALARLAYSPSDTGRILPRTFGALVGAGYITVAFGEAEETYRPGRSWSKVRRHRTVRYVIPTVTAEGRAYLAAKGA